MLGFSFLLKILNLCLYCIPFISGPFVMEILADWDHFIGHNHAWLLGQWNGDFLAARTQNDKRFQPTSDSLVHL